MVGVQPWRSWDLANRHSTREWESRDSRSMSSSPAWPYGAFRGRGSVVTNVEPSLCRELMRSRRGRRAESRSVTPLSPSSRPTSPSRVLNTISKELLERLILVPWGVCVDDTQPDLRRSIRSRLIRGPVNPVKDGGPVATRDLDWQDVSFLFIRACVFQDLRYIRTTLSHGNILTVLII